MALILRLRISIQTKAYFSTYTVPKSVDWRNMGVLTPVRKQKKSTGWACAAATGMEAAYTIRKGEFIHVSVQELVDCTPKIYKSRGVANTARKGGFVAHACEYVLHKKGVSSEFHYPYTGFDQKCKAKWYPKLTPIDNIIFVPRCDEGALMWAVSLQPVLASIALPVEEEERRAFKRHT